MLQIGNTGIEEVMSYVEVYNRIKAMIEAEQTGDTSIFTFKKILDHQGPLKVDSSNWKGSSYNVRVLWEDTSETWEPLSVMKVDEPITCAEYADNKNLLGTHGWKSLRKYTKNKKKLDRLLKQNLNNYAKNLFTNLEFVSPGILVRPGIWRERKTTLDGEI